MIKQLLLTFFLLCSLCLLSSCTIFGGGSAEDNVGEGEDYYEDEEGGEGLEDPSEEGALATEGDDMAEGDSISDSSMGEDIHYIDEEEKDLIEEDAIVEEDSDEAYAGHTADIGDEASLPDEEGQESGVDTSSFFDSSAPTPVVPEGTQVTPPTKKWVSYKKIKSQPYNLAGFLINAVYIAREGDSMQSISQKIFSADQTSQLYAINPHLKRRNVKTGDKIYYPSPQRPQDSGQLLFYFEDKGIPPNYHQVQAGENIRSVASSLLGHKDSWKEIWATNPELESKGELNQALTIKYWPAGGDPGQEPEEPVAPVEPNEPSPDRGGDMEEESDPESPPEEDDLLMEEEGPAPPPPESGVEEDPMPSVDEENETQVSSQFSQTNITIAGLLALSALVLGFVIIKRKWKKKTDFDYTAVNYEINE